MQNTAQSEGGERKKHIRLAHIKMWLKFIYLFLRGVGWGLGFLCWFPSLLTTAESCFVVWPPCLESSTQSKTAWLPKGWYLSYRAGENKGFFYGCLCKPVGCSTGTFSPQMCLSPLAEKCLASFWSSRDPCCGQLHWALADSCSPSAESAAITETWFSFFRHLRLFWQFNVLWRTGVPIKSVPLIVLC